MEENQNEGQEEVPEYDLSQMAEFLSKKKLTPEEEEQKMLAEGWVQAGVARGGPPQRELPCTPHKTIPGIYDKVEYDASHMYQNMQSNDQEQEDEDNIEINFNGLNVTGKYNILSELGSGATSIVKLGEDKDTKSKVAIKCITEATYPSYRNNSAKVIAETLKLLSHPNIATVIELFEEKEGLFVVLELYTGTLTKVLQQSQNLVWTEKDACRTITQILGAIQYIHSLGIIHGDLTTGNILSADANGTQVKISGFTKAQKEENESDILCEPYFKAPELLEGKKHGKSVDLWAIGCLSFLFLSGKFPFADTNLMRLNANIKNGKFEFVESDWSQVDPKAKEFIKGLLTINPDERTTVEKALNDPWILGGGSSVVLTPFAANLKGNKFTH